MIINVDSSGSTINLSYQYASGCQAQSLSMIKSDTADTWYSVAVLGNTIEITVDDNSSSETPRSGSVTPYIESIGDICTNNTIEIFQDGSVACGCGDIIIDFFAIPVDGVSADTKIGEYGTSSGQCLIDSDSLKGSIKQIESKAKVADLYSMNGEIFVNSEISANTSDSFKEFDVEIVYDGNTCASYRLSQEGKEVQCDCKHIEYFIKERNVNFGVHGSWEQEVLIASADTHGCGDLLATANSGSVFSADTIYEHISPNGHEYRWSVIVNAYNDARTSTINIYFKKRDEPFFSNNCRTSVTVHCGPQYEFYTCSSLIRHDNERVLPQYIFVENFYDKSICFNAKTYLLKVRSFNNTRVQFVPRLINDTTQSYLDDVKNQYINIPYDASGVELKTEEVSEGYSSYVHSTENVIRVSPSNSARKFYFAIDCYVNDEYCFTREGIFVANQSITSVTKCDLINFWLRSKELSNVDCFDNWRCYNCDSDTCQIACLSDGITADTTPNIFRYGTNGKDIQGENNWEAIYDIFEGQYYNDFLVELVKQRNNHSADTYYSDGVNTNCLDFYDLPFNRYFTPRIKILDTGFTFSTNWEFEMVNGEYTNRVRLIKGDTKNGYLKEWMSLGYEDDGYFEFIDDAGERIQCDNELNLRIFLRACETQEHVDNLDYSSCEALSEHISASTSDALVFDNVAHEAWLAYGDIRRIEFLGTIPHEQVKLTKTYPAPSQVITIPNLYWDDPDLDAEISKVYWEGSKLLRPELNFNREVIGDFVDGLCTRCEANSYNVNLPDTAVVVTAFTVNSLTCVTSTELHVNDFATYIDFGCYNYPSCYDITNVEYTIPVTNYTFDAGATIEIGTFVGTFRDTANTFDGSNYALNYYVDEGAAIYSFAFDYTLKKIYMTFADSSYRAEGSEKDESFTLKAQYKNCSDEWKDCINTDFKFFLTNLPT